jgi:hypothetical protein
VWANEESLRSHSTSGGFAAAASKYFVENYNGVIGVAFDGRSAKHIYVDNDYELSKFQGSKYVWSDASEVYSSIAEHLPHQSVLFFGTGCQVAGVLARFHNHPNRDRLYTIDLICGGVPSDLLMQTFFKENPNVEAITSFRTKRKYELKGIVKGRKCCFRNRHFRYLVSALNKLCAIHATIVLSHLLIVEATLQLEIYGETVSQRIKERKEYRWWSSTQKEAFNYCMKLMCQRSQ